jgi:hypothetical protein
MPQHKQMLAPCWRVSALCEAPVSLLSKGPMSLLVLGEWARLPSCCCPDSTRTVLLAKRFKGETNNRRHLQRRWRTRGLTLCHSPPTATAGALTPSTCV